MASGSDNTPVVAIVGETASGKTALSLYLSQLFPGEIVAADSRTIYKGLDIGTAKPTPQERMAIHHYGLDIVTPDQSFSAADFQQLAKRAVYEIGLRSKVAYLVGGTGLYMDGFLYNFTFRPKADEDQRKDLEALTIDQLQHIITQRGLNMPMNSKNPRHLIRTIETSGYEHAKSSLRPRTILIGVKSDESTLKERLAKRVDAMVDMGFIDEVKHAAKRYGWDAPGLSAPGYRAFREYVEGRSTLEEAKRQFIQNDFRLAKRQRTWFKRNKDINWISKQEEAVDLVTTFLNK